ncbi:MAG: AlpA family transcriptional regulator [Methylotenera sp.]|nr:MAG: AlpA family transcriptional regulator [Methylotenera sp.]PPD18624.1 MAG: AlpA family transcriptional regulator [Methylotenera sp.]
MEKRFLKLPEVSKRVAKSRSSIYKAISEGKFPKSYPNGDRAVAWLASDIDAFIDAQIAKAGA